MTRHEKLHCYKHMEKINKHRQEYPCGISGGYGRSGCPYKCRFKPILIPVTPGKYPFFTR